MAVICKKQPYTVVVEKSVSITRKEYDELCLKLACTQPFTIFCFVAAVFCLVLIIINLSGAAKIFDDTIPIIPSVIILYVITLPTATYRRAGLIYHSTLMLMVETVYTFDDEKISWRRDGAEGYFAWKYCTHYKFVGKFLLIYTGTSASFYLKKDSLTQEEITFIQSNIKTPGE